MPRYYCPKCNVEFEPKEGELDNCPKCGSGNTREVKRPSEEARHEYGLLAGALAEEARDAAETLRAFSPMMAYKITLTVSPHGHRLSVEEMREGQEGHNLRGVSTGEDMEQEDRKELARLYEKAAKAESVH